MGERTNGEKEPETIVNSVDLDPENTVVVSKGIGVRFHRPNGIGYDTACKTSFKHSARKMALVESIAEGFTPCVKHGCFPEIKK